MQNLKNKKTAYHIVLSCVIISLLAMFIVSLYYNYTLQKQIDKRDRTIQQLVWGDSVFHAIMEVKYDSLTKTESYAYKVFNGHPMTYNQLSRQLDSVSNRANYYDYYQQSILYDIKDLKLENDTLIAGYNSLMAKYYKKREEYAQTQNDLVDKYNTLVTKYNSQNKEWVNLQDSLNVTKRTIALIESTYSIKSSVKYEGNYRTITIGSMKLDSALMLYNDFKDRIFYDSKKNKWMIKLK